MNAHDQFEQSLLAFDFFFKEGRTTPAEVGVFGLTSQKWELFSRKEFTNRREAIEWARFHFIKASQQRRFQKRRMSIVAPPDSLDANLADYEAKRMAGDPDFTPREVD